MEGKEQGGGAATMYAGLEWKVKQLVTAAINPQTMRPALTKHFAEGKLDAASLEDIQAALHALQSIEERDLAEDEGELSNAGKIHVLKQVVAYLEHAPYAELPFSSGEIVREVMTNFYSIRAATANLVNYLKLQSIHREVNDENVAEHCYEHLFNYRIEPLAKNSHAFRTILKYLSETNTTPKTSLQVKEVFVLQEKDAYAEQVHGADGFASAYKDKKRMLLWHGVPRHHVFHALTAEIPQAGAGSFVFSSQFAYAVCQEQETCHSGIHRDPGAQENACLLLAEVVVGEPERTAWPGWPIALPAMRNDPCRPASQNWPMERRSDKVLRNDHAYHNETNASYGEVAHLSDGVVVPQGPVRSLPLGMLPSAPGHSPIYTAPSHKHFRLRFLVVVDYLASDSSSSSSSSLTSPSPSSSSSLLSISPPSSSSSSLPLPLPLPSFPSLPSFPLSPPSSTSFSLAPPPMPPSASSPSSFSLAPSFTHAPRWPATSGTSGAWSTPLPPLMSYSSAGMAPASVSSFVPSPYVSARPPHPISTMGFTLRPDWQFYARPAQTRGRDVAELRRHRELVDRDQLQGHRRRCRTPPSHHRVRQWRGLRHRLRQHGPVQHVRRQDDPDRIRKIRRVG